MHCNTQASSDFLSQRRRLCSMRSISWLTQRGRPETGVCGPPAASSPVVQPSGSYNAKRCGASRDGRRDLIMGGGQCVRRAHPVINQTFMWNGSRLPRSGLVALHSVCIPRFPASTQYSPCAVCRRSSPVFLPPDAQKVVRFCLRFSGRLVLIVKLWFLISLRRSCLVASRLFGNAPRKRIRLSPISAYGWFP